MAAESHDNKTPYLHARAVTTLRTLRGGLRGALLLTAGLPLGLALCLAAAGGHRAVYRALARVAPCPSHKHGQP